MKLRTIQQTLDEEFRIRNHGENLNDFAVLDTNRAFVNDDFIRRSTALMTERSEDIEIVLTSVFITEEVVTRACMYENALIVTHHNFDYHEDERGIEPIKPEYLEALERRNISIYAAHAPLDTHPVYGTSKCLAELCGIKIEKYFYDYFGSPTALTGRVNRTTFDRFSEQIREKLQRPFLTMEKHSDSVEKIAVVAGGGDLPDLLQQVHDYGCDTLFTGTVEHRWALPFIQEGNKQFHELNRKLKINLIGGTHYGTERPAMMKLTEYFKGLGIESRYIEDESLLNAE